MKSGPRDPIAHPAQKQALTDLLTRFEGAADEEIAAVQAEVVKDMGW